MPKRFVLIDYENVQPDVLDRLDPKQYGVFVFVGANQSRMSTSLVTALQRFDQSRCIQVSGNGPDALDFHIAYYLGRIAVMEPDSVCYVVSADTGYDPLITHLADERIRVKRITSLDEVSKNPTRPKTPTHSAPSPTGKLSQVVDDLKRRGNSAPRSVKALRGTINACFKNSLPDQEISGLIEQLKQRKVVAVQGTKVSYPT